MECANSKDLRRQMAEFEMTVSQMLEAGDRRSPANQILPGIKSPDSYNDSPERVNVEIASPVSYHLENKIGRQNDFFI